MLGEQCARGEAANACAHDKYRGSTDIHVIASIGLVDMKAELWSSV